MDIAADIERLQVQAQAWQRDADALLDTIGIQPGWQCIDLGCGPFGILASLSRRVGASGRVVGLDCNSARLDAARAFVAQSGLPNVELYEGNAYQTGLPRNSFDFCHARCLVAPSGGEAALVREMTALTRPGGIVALQEPDTISWTCYPPRFEWIRLNGLVQDVVAQDGGDFNAGQTLFAAMRGAGLADVRLRAAILALHGGDPYMRYLPECATALRDTIVQRGMAGATELDALIAACEGVAADPQSYVLSFTLIQCWGRKVGNV